MAGLKWILAVLNRGEIGGCDLAGLSQGYLGNAAQPSVSPLAADLDALNSGFSSRWRYHQVQPVAIAVASGLGDLGYSLRR